ncbi:unnamed protein product, partial [Ilex paraguariensis]
MRAFVATIGAKGSIRKNPKIAISNNRVELGDEMRERLIRNLIRKRKLEDRLSDKEAER